MALGNVVARLLVRLGLDKKEFDTGVAQAKTQTKGLTGSLNEVRGASDLMTGALKGAGVLGLAYMGREALSTTWNMAELGAESLRLEASFDRLADRANMSGDALLRSLKQTSAGTISEMDLMRSTSGLLASGIQADSQDITDAMEIARLKAQQFGISTTEAYTRMLTGARKFSVEMLDELGITIKAETAYRRKAEAVGVAVSALNDAQKAGALWEAILADGRQELEEYGGAVDDFVTGMERAEVAVDDMTAAIGEGLAPVVADTATGLTKFVTETALGFSLWGVALEGVISPLDVITIGTRAQAIANERGIDAARAYVAQLLEVRQALDGVESEQEGWLLGLGELPGYVTQAEVALGSLTGFLRTVSGEYGAMQSLPQKMFDLAGPQAAEAWEILQQEKDRAEQEWLENSIRRLHGFEDENEDVASSVGATWQDTYDDMRSSIEAALQPTSVTAWDIHLTSQGQYVDQWDEAARRLDAIADAGFGALDAHPDWAAILEIPQEVLDAGDDALKAWASQTASDVRNLFRPDLLNVGAAADAVEQYMQEQAARELSIDLVIGELVARGGTTAADAEKQVRQAYGLETEAVDVPINLVSAVAGDEGEGWSAAADQLVSGLKDGITGSSLVTEFVGYFRADITNNETLLSGSGEALWNTVELGILLRLDRADYASLFVSKLGPLVGTWLLENGYNTQGEGEP